MCVCVYRVIMAPSKCIEMHHTLFDNTFVRLRKYGKRQQQQQQISISKPYRNRVTIEHRFNHLINLNDRFSVRINYDSFVTLSKNSQWTPRAQPKRKKIFLKKYARLHILFGVLICLYLPIQITLNNKIFKLKKIIKSNKSNRLLFSCPMLKSQYWLDIQNVCFKTQISVL